MFFTEINFVPRRILLDYRLSAGEKSGKWAKLRQFVFAKSFARI